MMLIDVLLLLIFIVVSLRIFFPRISLEFPHSRFINELFSVVSIFLLTSSLVFLLLYDISVLNVVLVTVTGLVLFSMLTQVESGIFRGLALTFFVIMTAALLFKLSAVAEIFAVLSFSLFVMVFLKDFINGKQDEN